MTGLECMIYIVDRNV